jgi:drug/metabolite transporter (DMT)-like permease
MLAIALALGASICWGSGDFLGGLTTRRASLWAVIVGSQVVGLVGATLVVLLAGHGWPGLHAVWPVMLGGLASVVAISCFYKALAIGSMSIVAPISASNALIPFLVGLATGERPSAAQLAGVALAAAGVLLVASERARAGDTIGVAALPNEPAVEPMAVMAAGTAAHVPRRNQRRAIVLALTAAVAMGLVLVGYDATARYDALWAMLGGRISSVAVFAVVFLVLRPHLEMRRSALPFIVAVGLLDTGANGLFALATTQGYLSLVSVLGAVYPVVTVLLAYGLLRERIAPHQMVGAVGTLAGIALIAAG